eukprot:TsM_000027000 transcript=TsM_000027000 gene=TsM_000027000
MYAAVTPSEDDRKSEEVDRKREEKKEEENENEVEMEDGSDEDVEAEHKCGSCICGPVSHLPSPVHRAMLVPSCPFSPEQNVTNMR